MRYPRFRNSGRELDEFQKEALRLVKELADDEKDFKDAREDADKFECEGNVSKALNKAEYLEGAIERKMRIMETLIRG